MSLLILLGVSATALAAVVAGAMVVRRTEGAVQLFVGGVVGLVLLAAPLALECAVALSLRRPGVWFFDIRLSILAIPVLLSLLAARLVLGSRDSARILFAPWVWFGFSGLANTVNGCQPGWCARYGFPLSLYAWSDAIVIINGEISDPFRPTALAIDALIIVVVGSAIYLRGRSSHVA